jgi:CDP-diacylglycerol---glycerol-3-phosphate 3-phosphatidyltransferase
MITLLRVVIAPVFYMLVTSVKPFSIRIACYLFVLGAITDYLDGWFARRYEETTNWGIFFDPLADKILTTAAFLAFANLGIISWWMVIVIFIRDIGTTVMRIYADSKSTILVTLVSAKWKTFFQLLFIIYILILFYLKNSNFGFKASSLDSMIYSDLTHYLMLGLTLLTIWTALEYLFHNRILFKLSKKM